MLLSSLLRCHQHLRPNARPGAYCRFVALSRSPLQLSAKVHSAVVGVEFGQDPMVSLSNLSPTVINGYCCVREARNLISDGSGVGVFEWKFDRNLTHRD